MLKIRSGTVITGAAALLLTMAHSAQGQPADKQSTATPPHSWTVYDYNPSGRALAPRVSAASMPATMASDGTVSFPFKLNTYTALLSTTDESLTGDLSNKTLQVTVSVAGGAGTFKDQNGGGCLPDMQTVRFKFTSSTAGGTTGFFTQFWWSNPVHVTLSTDPQPSMTITQIVNSPSMWSDWNGKSADSSPEIMEAFQDAIHKVNAIGLSFGGGCFFENGVTTSDGQGTFSSKFTETP